MNYAYRTEDAYIASLLIAAGFGCAVYLIIFLTINAMALIRKFLSIKKSVFTENIICTKCGSYKTDRTRISEKKILVKMVTWKWAIGITFPISFASAIFVAVTSTNARQGREAFFGGGISLFDYLYELPDWIWLQTSGIATILIMFFIKLIPWLRLQERNSFLKIKCESCGFVVREPEA
jgi:hypothetical protein